MKRYFCRKTSRYEALRFFKNSLKFNYEHFENDAISQYSKYQFISFPDLPCTYSFYKKGSKQNLRKNASVAIEMMLEEFVKKNKQIPSYDSDKDYFTIVRKRMKRLERILK